MHAAFIRPGGISYDAFRPFKWYYNFLMPFAKKLNDMEELLTVIEYLKIAFVDRESNVQYS